MVRLEEFDKFMDDVAEMFGFLFAQEIAKSPLTPKDTNKMASSFPATFEYNKNTKKIQFKTPFYTEYVMKGTKYMDARPFVLQIFNQKSRELMKQAFRIVDKKYKSS